MKVSKRKDMVTKKGAYISMFRTFRNIIFDDEEEVLMMVNHLKMIDRTAYEDFRKRHPNVKIYSVEGSQIFYNFLHKIHVENCAALRKK